MLKSVAVVFLALLMLTACGGDDDDGDRIGGTLILATTTSTRDSGLLDSLMPVFEDRTGIEVKVIAVGSGAALEMAREGNADAVLVHSPAAELEYVGSGDLSDGQLVMHNDFVIVGPLSDPAGTSSSVNVGEALSLIASSAIFVSRGDDSGTHKKELQLWEAAGVDRSSANQIEETGQGMGATLQIASQKRGYTLTDRATYLTQEDDLDLQIVFEGAQVLLNIYHVYAVNPERHTQVNAEQAQAFIAFMVKAETQQRIAEYGIAEFGQPLFFPDAWEQEPRTG
ncbi:MAG TPA: substrate-binding domain-containing protein [Dehalococcoidia bacterium]|jgi:tungstate transport system substrate-binding protein|nr:substrate-binding domain-containing protein [Dehalococcoidia bacterium]